MNLKKLPYWLKGGIIFFVISVVVTGVLAILFPGNLAEYSAENQNSFMPPITYPEIATWKIVTAAPSGILMSFFFKKSPFSPENSILIYSCLSYALVFLLGSILGLLYGKIKNRNKSLPIAE